MQKDRKKAHKEVVKFIRRVNKQIGSDEYLGLNRFKLNMWSERMYRFSDGSGVILYFVIKITDNATGNSAYFSTDDYRVYRDINMYANDFLIRCSSGYRGHIPSLHYMAYDVHEVIDYDGRKDRGCKQSNEAIATYDWTNWNLF